MIRGLIFDVDGTLVSLKVDGARLRSTTSSALSRLGFDVSFMGEGNMYTQDIIDRAKLQVESGAVKVDFESVKATLNRALDELEMDWNAQAEPIHDTVKVLAKLRSSSVKLATLTNSGRAPSDWLLRKHGLYEYFDFTLSRDEVPAMKPRADGMLKAVSMMGLPREQLLYVGDSVIDVRAARAADLRIASVVSGRYTHERLREEGCDYVLDSLSDLLKIL
ncbi:MAG: HAD family hydrolase [Nitrososphaerota archaeon]|nr:HAD family hydrolase [Nitrososphaerota archaeon]